MDHLIQTYKQEHSREKYPELDDKQFLAVQDLVEYNVERLEKIQTIHPSVAKCLMQHILVQGTQMWLAKRALPELITSTELSSVRDKNRFMPREGLFKKKIFDQEPFVGNAATRVGNLLEDDILLKYEELSGKWVLKFGLLIRQCGQVIVAGSPDGITTDGWNTEVKTLVTRQAKPLMGHPPAINGCPVAEIPDYYEHQILQMMAVGQLTGTHFIQYDRGIEGFKDPIVYVTERPWTYALEREWNTCLKSIQQFTSEVKMWIQNNPEQYAKNKQWYANRRKQLLAEAEKDEEWAEHFHVRGMDMSLLAAETPQKDQSHQKITYHHGSFSFERSPPPKDSPHRLTDKSRFWDLFSCEEKK